MNKLLLTVVVGLVIGAYLAHGQHNTNYISVRFEDPSAVQVASESAIAQVVHKVEPKAYAADPVSADVEDMLRYIHQAESTSGKNTTPGALHLICRAQGKWNELGYGGMRLKICFTDEAEGRAKVGNWLQRHLEKFDGSVAKTLCYYNLGLEEINCKYYQNYLGGM